jgi:hypothetical protein
MKRFSVKWDGMTELAVMCPRQDGEWVKYSDVEPLINQLKEVQAFNVLFATKLDAATTELCAARKVVNALKESSITYGDAPEVCDALKEFDEAGG